MCVIYSNQDSLTRLDALLYISFWCSSSGNCADLLLLRNPADELRLCWCVYYSLISSLKWPRLTFHHILVILCLKVTWVHTQAYYSDVQVFDPLLRAVCFHIFFVSGRYASIFILYIPCSRSSAEPLLLTNYVPWEESPVEWIVLYRFDDLWVSVLLHQR